MYVKDVQSKQALQRRLHRIEGQVRGVAAMLESDRDCLEVLQQLAAIRSAVQGVSAAVLQTSLSDCLLDCSPEERGQREKMVGQLLAAIGKAP